MAKSLTLFKTIFFRIRIGFVDIIIENKAIVF